MEKLTEKVIAFIIATVVVFVIVNILFKLKVSDFMVGWLGGMIYIAIIDFILVIYKTDREKKSKPPTFEERLKEKQNEKSN